MPRHPQPPDAATLAFAKGLRRRQTPAEQRLWYVLRNRRFAAFKFRRQVPVGPYIADFLCKQARLIIEVDGSQHAGAARDVIRDQWLAGHGYLVHRVWNNDVMHDTDAVLQGIVELTETRLRRFGSRWAPAPGPETATPPPLAGGRPLRPTAAR